MCRYIELNISHHSYLLCCWILWLTSKKRKLYVLLLYYLLKSSYEKSASYENSQELSSEIIISGSIFKGPIISFSGHIFFYSNELLSKYGFLGENDYIIHDNAWGLMIQFLDINGDFSSLHISVVAVTRTYGGRRIFRYD